MGAPDSVAAAHDAWIEAQAEAAGLLRASPLCASALDEAEGHRYLTRLASTALWMFVEHADPLHPTLYRNTDEHKKFGVDNPDNVYLRCALDGRETYRLSGWRGEAPYLGLSIGAGFFGRGEKRQGTLAQHHLDEFEVAADGTFELQLGPDPGPGNWIRLDPDATGLLIRQTFYDRSMQRPADLRIERVGGEPPAALDPARHAADLRAATGFLLGCTRLFLRMSEGWAKQPNRLVGASGASTRHIHGDPDIFYASGWFRLDDGEALVIDVEPAQKFLYWGFQLCNVWLESLDYRHHRVATNQHLAETSQEGGGRIVVSHEDPGHPNWIETAGHREGAMCFRWLLAEADPPVPSVRLVKLSELRG